MIAVRDAAARLCEAVEKNLPPCDSVGCLCTVSLARALRAALDAGSAEPEMPNGGVCPRCGVGWLGSHACTGTGGVGAVMALASAAPAPRIETDPSVPLDTVIFKQDGKEVGRIVDIAPVVTPPAPTVTPIDSVPAPRAEREAPETPPDISENEGLGWRDLPDHTRDYIRWAHDWLWCFVHIASPGASGRLSGPMLRAAAALLRAPSGAPDRETLARALWAETHPEYAQDIIPAYFMAHADAVLARLAPRGDETK